MTEKIEIKIDINQLTFGDLEIIDKASKGQTELREVIPLLDRIVVGGVRHLPITEMTNVMTAIEKATSDMGNPETPQGN